MANQIILNKQIFRFDEIAKLFPGDVKGKKVFFQAELQSLENGDAKFGIVAYAACGKDGKWTVCGTVKGTDMGEPQKMDFIPFALANNELVLGSGKKGKDKKKKKKKKDCDDGGERNAFLELYKKVAADPELAKKAVFSCTTSISKNPHLNYDVTLESGGTSARTRCNPSPPDNPQY